MAAPRLDVTYDPVLPQKEAANYLGFRGADPTRSLRRLRLERTQIPGRGRPRFGYRLSVLNAYLELLQDPRARTPLLREPSPDPAAAREHGRFARATA